MITVRNMETLTYLSIEGVSTAAKGIPNSLAKYMG